MILKIFSIHDKATDAFNTPFFMLTKAEAIRAFTSSVQDENSNINKYPEDFTLYQIGEYDNHNGVIMQDGAQRVLTGLDAKIDKKSSEQQFPARDVQEMKAITS